MIQIIKGRSFGSEFGRAIGEGLGKGGNQGLNLGMENKAIKKNYGLDLSGINDPETRKQLIADQLKFGRQLKQAEATAGTISGNQDQINDQAQPQRNREDIQELIQGNKPQKMEFPGFKGNEGRNTQQQNQSNSSNVRNPAKGATNLPQEETQGVKAQILSPDEVTRQGEIIAAERRSKGMPMTDEEGIDLADQQNNLKRKYNSDVEADTKQRVEAQKGYGTTAENALMKLFPDSELTDEMRAYAQKIGEEASKGKSSEADINKQISRQVSNFKDAISKVRESAPAPRLFQKGKEFFTGEGKTFDQRKNDLRLKLKPLLDAGMYDTSRKLLSELEYYPEERESILTDFSENAKKALANIPNYEKSDKKLIPYPGAPISEENYTPEDLSKIREGIRSVFTVDPNTNLILARKAFEDKNVDYKTFKDELNQMVFDGELELNDDQAKALDTLENPPLSKLGKILHGVNLQGR